MKYLIFLTAAVAVFALAVTVADAKPNVFAVPTADGSVIHGQADAPENARRGAVVLVAGTGHFDRDVRFGRSGSPRDLIFRDLASRLNDRGLATVRFDRRGVEYRAGQSPSIDARLAATSTMDTLRDDLAAVYGWTRSPAGLGAKCIVVVAHSEGLLHVGRLARSGAHRPKGVIAFGGLLESPVSALRWQLSERDVHSLRLMDTNQDGFVTNAEVNANYASTPSGAWDRVGPFIQEDGVWTADDIAQVTLVQGQIYENLRAQALAEDDRSPYPNAESPLAQYAWWKAWFTDAAPVAVHLRSWRVPMIFHYGSRDSQTNDARQREAGKVLGKRASFVVHPGRGHTLGDHPLFGPMDPDIANELADEAAKMCAT